MTACHVFIDEVSRVRQMRESYPETGTGMEDELMESYRNGLNVMSLFSQEGKLMRESPPPLDVIIDELNKEFILHPPEYQLSKVQDSFAAI